MTRNGAQKDLAWSNSGISKSPLAMLAHTWLWMIVIVVFVPSFFAHCMLIIFTIRMRRSNKEYYKNLFYRLFVTQGVIELVLLTTYLAVKILIKERLAGDDFIMSTNGGIFPKLYYYGTIYYFFTVQVWGVVVQSLARFLMVCAPDSIAKRWLDSVPDLAWAAFNTLVPFLVLFREVFQDAPRLVLDPDGHAYLLYSPLVSHSNATQSVITTMGAAIISALFNALVLRKLCMFKNDLQSIRKHRLDVQLGLVGCIHLIAQCLMAACHLIVMCSLNNQPFANVIRELYMIPAVILTFVNPWMLLITDKNLRTK